MLKNKKIVAMLAALSFGSAAMSATTANLVLTGTIPSSVSISVAPKPAASSLDLTTTQANLSVATATENSNSPGGYIIQASSTNGSHLNHSTLSAFVAYTISYAGGSAVTLTTSAQTVKTQATGGTYTNVNSDVAISYTGAPGNPGGTYTDTVTLTIVGQ